MAAGAYIFPNKAKLNMFNATKLLDPANTFKLALVGSGWTPDNSDTGNEVWADVSANEIANGAGYTTGGVTLTGVTTSQTGGVVKFTYTGPITPTWTSSGSFPAWRRGVIYASGTLNGKVNPIVGHFLGDGTNIDVPVTTSGNTLIVAPHASGVLSAT